MAMVALHTIHPGQQLFNDFGQLPRSDLLRRYGYITDRYKRWDVVEISLETVTNGIALYNKTSHNEVETRVSGQKLLCRKTQ